MSCNSFRDCLSNAWTFLRSSIACCVNSPCLIAFPLCLGAPEPRASMHPAALLAGRRRRPIGAAGTALGSAARARQHWPDVAGMPAHGFNSGVAGVTSGFGLPMISIGSIRASVIAAGETADLSVGTAGAFCVTLPTIAWPPSWTETLF
jgi:hypothetical protein